MSRIPLVLQAVANTPWAIEPLYGQRLVSVLERKARGERLTPEAIQAVVGERTAAPASSTPGSVMVLPVHGVLGYRLESVTDVCGGGGTSVQHLSRDFQKALNDPSIAAIVFEFDSPGGSVEGIPELAAKIFAARDVKPIIAVANTLCASAAYWLASACGEVVVTPSGEVGSIGVFMLHMDQAKYDEDLGVAYTLIKAGKYKAEGLSHFPLDEAAKEAYEARVNEWYDQFTRGVATMRGTSPKDVREGYGQGRTVGAKQAVAQNLADRVGTLDDVLGKLLKKSAKAGGARAEEPAPAVQASDDSEPKAVLILAAARGGADGLEPDTPAPAAQAKEQMMTEEEKAALAAAAKAEAAERGKQLGALATQHGLQAELPNWLASEKTVAQVKDEILEAKATSARGAAPRIHVGDPNEGKRPFANLAEQVKSIVTAGREGKVDPRLHEANKIAAASGMSEGIGSEGGFAIMPDFATQILEPIYETGKIMSRITQFPASARSNGLKMNVVDETSRVTGSRFGGLQMYWKSEGDAPTPKKLKTRLFELNLKKLIGAAYLTEELREDGPQMATLLENSFRQESEFMLEAAVIAGSGAGDPLGIKNSAAKVTVAIEGTQTIANTSTFISKNVAKMLARIPAGLWDKVVFLYNPGLLSDLINATIGTSSVPVWMPPGGLAGTPYGTILGRPAIPSELCEAVGTPGDLYAVALSEYVGLTKGGTKLSYSMHVKFLEDEEVLKITTRFDGAPVWKQAVTPFKGSDTWSPIVVLNTRS
jgi:HK97 family phage major capsid protein